MKLRFVALLAALAAGTAAGLIYANNVNRERTSASLAPQAGDDCASCAAHATAPAKIEVATLVAAACPYGTETPAGPNIATLMSSLEKAAAPAATAVASVSTDCCAAEGATATQAATAAADDCCGGDQCCAAADAAATVLAAPAAQY